MELGRFREDEACALSELIGRTLWEVNGLDYPPEHIAWLAAREGGRVVGCGAAARKEDGAWGISAVFVLPEYRGSGLGRRILAALEECAAAQGACRVELDASITAAGFYEHLGYRCRGGARMLKNNDVYEMEKRLGP